MADIILAKRVVDYVGLGAKGIPESQFRLLKELNPVLALLQGMGPDGAQLIQVDSAGTLRALVTGAGSFPGQGIIGHGLGAYWTDNQQLDAGSYLLIAAQPEL